MRPTTRTQRAYYFYLIVMSIFGLVIIADPSPDNHFYIRGIVDISNVWMGIGTIIGVLFAMWHKPKLWNLHYYFIIPLLISVQRSAMICLDPARAKVGIPVYLLAWGQIALIEYEEWKLNRANTNASN